MCRLSGLRVHVSPSVRAPVHVRGRVTKETIFSFHASHASVHFSVGSGTALRSSSPLRSSPLPSSACLIHQGVADEDELMDESLGGGERAGEGAPSGGVAAGGAAGGGGAAGRGRGAAADAGAQKTASFGLDAPPRVFFFFVAFFSIPQPFS